MDVTRINRSLKTLPKVQFSMFGAYAVLPNSDFKEILKVLAQVERSTTLWSQGPLDILLRSMIKCAGDEVV